MTAPRICAGGCGRQIVPETVPPRHRPAGVLAHGSRGLCTTCRHHARVNGTIGEFERINRSRDDVLDDWVVLRRQGYSRRQAAERIGMRFAALDRAIQRARRAGDPRAAAA